MEIEIVFCDKIKSILFDPRSAESRNGLMCVRNIEKKKKKIKSQFIPNI